MPKSETQFIALRTRDFSLQLLHKIILVCFLALPLLTLAPNLSSGANAQSITSSAAQSTKAEKQVPSDRLKELLSKVPQDKVGAVVDLLEILAADNASAKVAEAKPDMAFTNVLESTWRKHLNHVGKNIVAIPAMITGTAQTVLQIFSGRGLTGNLKFAGFFVFIIALALFAEIIAARMMQGWKKLMPVDRGDGSGIVFKNVFLRLTAEVLGLAVFFIVALIAAVSIYGEETDRFLATSFILSVLLTIRGMSLFLHFTLSPNDPAMRLASVDDWNAKFISRNLLILTGIVGVAIYLGQLVEHFQIDIYGSLRFWVTQYVYASIIYVTWRAREGITAIIKGKEDHLSPSMERIANWWPAGSIIAIAIQYFIGSVLIVTGAVELKRGIPAITLAIIIFMPFFDTVLRGIISRLLPPMQGKGEVAEEAYYETKNSYARIGRVVLILLFIMVIGRLWGIDFQDLAKQGFGPLLAANGWGFLTILAIGYVIWELSNLWVNRQLAKEGPFDASAMQGEGGGTGKTRLTTILPLVHLVLQITVITLTVLLGLSQLGVNITPLLAGAGVVGLAIGFGAQTLVKDVVSGIFFLLDDAFRLGEFIEIEGTVGTVVKISVRSLQLRHPNGPVHIIPYGEIPKMTNNSRDYVIMKLRFTVPFDTDMDLVRRLYRKIGEEMLEHPTYGQDFIQPFKFQGVIDVDDIGIVYRGKFTCKPGAQWVIRKEIYTRVQKAFEENNIQFARKEVRVQIPGLEEHTELNENQKTAIAAAAGEVATAEPEQKNKVAKKDEPI